MMPMLLRQRASSFYSRLALVAVCALASGCASGERESSSDAGVQDSAQHVRGRLLRNENGLEVRQLVIADDPELVARAMTPWMDGSGIDSTTADRLRRNGFRLVRVPVEHVDEMIYDLGGASMDVSSWHGQMLQWRDLHTLPLGDAGRAMAVDGRVRQYRGGELQLMARSWVLPMETGPRMQLEIVPQHLQSESQYHRLLGQERVQATAIASLAMHVLLEPGYAYVLTCECPQRMWSDEERDGDEPADGQEGNGLMGPDVQPPLTLGQLMLSSQAGRQSRGMLVFTPRIAANLFPPGEPLSIGQQASRDRN